MKDNDMLKGEINEKDIEKENLSSDQIEDVAGGAPACLHVDMEQNGRAPARSVDMEQNGRAPARSVDMEQSSVVRGIYKDAPDKILLKDAPENK